MSANGLRAAHWLRRVQPGRHGPGGCRAERILDACSRAEAYEAEEARRG